ncbi:MAG: hypothetical protein Q9165_003986 [Trypethelium subeluteriae]
MRTLRSTSRLISRCCQGAPIKPLTSARTSARNLHLRHSLQPSLLISQVRAIPSDYKRSSTRYSSSDSSSNPKVHRPIQSDAPDSSAASEPLSSETSQSSTYRPLNPTRVAPSYDSYSATSTSQASPALVSPPPLPPRWEATHPSSKPSWVTEPSGIPDPIPSARPDEPAYALAFTCKPNDYECGHRAWHRVSKHGYHHGTIFSDSSVTIEDLMKQKGELVRRGSISDDSDVEFWDDDAQRRKELERAAGIKRREEEAVAQGYVK